MLIRRETPADWPRVRHLVSDAFSSPQQGAQSAGEPVEARLLDWLRADIDWLPRLSLVAIANDQIFGHVLCTRGRVDGRPALGLAPLSVISTQQGRGIGTGLMHAVLAAADALDEPLVALLGDEGYYSRFGFVPASRVGIDAPDAAWGDHFQVRTLTCYSGQTGRFEYAEPFARL